MNISKVLEDALLDAGNKVNKQMELVNGLMKSAGVASEDVITSYLSSCDEMRDLGVLYFSMLNTKSYLDMQKLNKSMLGLPTDMRSPTELTASGGIPLESFIPDREVPGMVGPELELELGASEPDPEPAISREDMGSTKDTKADIGMGW